MTLFTALLVLIFERLFKLGEHWRLDHRLEASLQRVKHSSLGRTLGMITTAMGVTSLLLRTLQGVLFNVPMLLVWLPIGSLCIGAGKVRLHYHAYPIAASRNDSHARATTAGELTMIHGVPAGCDGREYLCELQNALLRVNFRSYLASLLWLTVEGTWGPVTLMGYASLRAWQYWLARHQMPRHRLQSGTDTVFHVLDWVPVRPAGVVYALVGHGRKALSVWFVPLGDFHTSQYQVLTRLAQFSLAHESHVDKVETPRAAASMVKKTSFVVVVVIALPMIYGALV